MLASFSARWFQDDIGELSVLSQRRCGEIRHSFRGFSLSTDWMVPLLAGEGSGGVKAAPLC